MTTVPDRPDLAVIRVGDIVRRATGTRLWRVDYFWPDGQTASLVPADGRGRSSEYVTRLVVVERGEPC